MTSRNINHAILVAVLLSCGGCTPDAVELPYDPPVGSKWIIESQIQSADTRPDGPRSSLTRIRSEMTVDA